MFGTAARPFGQTGKTLQTMQLFMIVMPAFILFGYNQANLGGLIKLTDWNKTFPSIDTSSETGNSDNATLQGFAVAIFVIGAIIGSFSCSYLGDKFGRRSCVFYGATCTLIGEALEASAYSLGHLMVGRGIIGLGIGTLSSIVPVWQSESSAAQNRGQMVVITGLFICLGYTLESWVNYGFFQLEGPITWRVPIAIVAVFSFMLMGCVYMFPESPRWLVMKGRNAEALAALCAVKGLDESSFEAQAEISGIEVSLEETAKTGVKFGDMFKMGEDKLLYRFGLCMLLQFYQQMSGSNLISVYAPILFEDNMGMTAEMSKALSAGALTWKFASSFIAFFTVDRFGRRALFMFSGAGMACCMAALAISTSFPDNSSAQIAAAFFLYMYNFFVPIGFLGANFLYCTEVAPLRLRMAMSSISTANHWLWNFVVVMVTPVAIEKIEFKYYIVFAVIAASVVPSVYFLFPETMGRNLEEIDFLFKDTPSVFSTVKFAKTRPHAMPQEIMGEKDAKNVEHDEEKA